MVARGLRRQDGFIRQVFWLGLIVAVAAIVFLDGMALFNARQSVHRSAAKAAIEARDIYTETQDVARAELAAQAYLAKNNKELTAFRMSHSLDGTPVFNVSAKGHAETYAFKYLRKLGLKDWVNRMMNPTTTEAST